MHTLSDMAKNLNRPNVVLHGFQSRFELPPSKGACYSDAYLAFLRTIVYLRMLNIAEEHLLKLWHLEKKLLTLLHVNSTDSPTWFLDACGASSHPRNRLLLTNFDMGMELKFQAVQLGLNFSEEATELFSGKEMGEDALRILGQYLKLHTRVQSEVSKEMQLIGDASRWARRITS
jgi:hypothetical protein